MRSNYPLVILVLFILPAVVRPTTPLTGIVWAQNQTSPTDGSSSVALDYKDWAKKYRGIQEGLDKFQAKDLAGAMQQFKEAAEKYPELPPSELIVADLYIDENRIDLANNALDTAARKYPDDPETYLLLGNLAFQQNRNTDAALAFEKGAELLESYTGDSLRLKRLQLRLNAGLASLAERFDDWEQERPYLRQWVALDPQNTAARIRYARALFRNKRGRESYLELRTAQLVDEEIFSPAMLMAQFYMEEGNMGLAQQWLDSAAKKQPQNFKTQMMLAHFFWTNGQFAEAKKHAAQALALKQNDPDANLLMGKLAHYDHDYDTAIDLFEKIRSDESLNDPSQNEAARQHLIYAYAAEGSEENLQEALRLAESNNTADLPSLVAQCYALKRAGNKEKALAMLQAAQHSTQDPGTNYVFAYVLAEDGYGDKLLPLLDMALRGNALFIFRRDAEKLRAQIIAAQSSKEE
jgi:tetratricopeptide (TPR) repeat protein